ncbi:gluconokinase [Cocleimonas sp. KMM 6892]|uniref:gluconokinase n=1 Tax=unclassified Cocleimonas TaxID=2639732 RepID=UPI002DBF55A2|nr:MULTISPECIES: gluconokinase [unclassified Cocleimonas]MEB8433551.1 gluconokinase [Cocleimonas sp. KMM 6892]MEC4716362.1 gluconokinase [Cocleimonas sp. KMM 6895]MEC4745745.1 gluconokinase [Cocleimonas sp. KMM 6896]
MNNATAYLNNIPVIVVMGVSGCGKSTIGKALSTQLGLPFLEGDDFHPPENIEKMSNAIGLNDDDRWPWLDALGAAIHKKCNVEKDKKKVVRKGVIVSCSALKHSYRQRLLNASGEQILFVYLDGSRDTLLLRIQSRTEHYMPASLLDSQLETLEKPTNDELAITVSIEQSVDKIVDEILDKINHEAID